MYKPKSVKRGFLLKQSHISMIRESKNNEDRPDFEEM